MTVKDGNGFTAPGGKNVPVREKSMCKGPIERVRQK